MIVLTDIEFLEKQFAIAKEIVEKEDEPYKTEGFKIILQRLLDEISENTTTKPRNPKLKNPKLKNPKPSSSQINSAEIDKEILDAIDVNTTGYILKLEKTSDKCIAILDILSEKLPKNMRLTTDGLKTILGDKFGLTTITAESISMALKNVTGKHVSRVKIKAPHPKFYYTILTEGKKYIKRVISEVESNID